MHTSTMIGFVSLMVILLAGCTKTDNANTENWVDVYNTYDGHDTINNIIITARGDNLLHLDVKAVSGGYIYSYTMLQRVTVTSPTSSVINESTNLSGRNGLYHVQGSMTLTGSDLYLSAIATQGSDTQHLTFSGTK